ncbi:alpha-L-arabinofuranosidase [Pedobacter sp.]|uniref:alpha-L-arabinofuranosidase n=1 Tax=Pedobacter sp. TaxID=1411316 RepID=UPI003BA8CB38
MFTNKMPVQLGLIYFFVVILFSIIGCDKTGELAISDTFSTDSIPFKSQGAFFSDWSARQLTLPVFTDVEPLSKTGTTIINVNTSKVLSRVTPYINGNNANPFSGQMVTEGKLITHIKNLDPGIIRFPGGDISSLYFWNRTNKEKPADIPSAIFASNGDSTTNDVWYGKNDEPWTLSLENYYKLLSLTSSTGIITVNYGYARYGLSANPVQQAAHLAADWVRYDNGRTKFWEVGNESYGYWEPGWKIDVSLNKDKQPQIMSGTLYGKHFKVFADSMRKAAAEKGYKINIGAQLISRPTPHNINPAESSWNRDYFAEAQDIADYYIIHDYYTDYGENSAVKTILNSATIQTDAIKNYLRSSFLESGRVEKPIAMTEWNIFSTGSKQKISAIAGVHATICMAEMLKANLAMAARWDLLGKYDNGNDFGSISIGDEPDNSEKWNPRPIFFYMYYFKKLIGDRLIETSINGNSDILSYASSFSSGETSMVIINKSKSDEMVSVNIDVASTLKHYYTYTLEGEGSVDFSRKVFVNGIGPTGVSGGPSGYTTLAAKRSTISAGKININVPKYGVVYLIATNK